MYDETRHPVSCAAGACELWPPPRTADRQLSPKIAPEGSQGKLLQTRLLQNTGKGPGPCQRLD